jgi:hypothetical protein
MSNNLPEGKTLSEAQLDISPLADTGEGDAPNHANGTTITDEQQIRTRVPDPRRAKALSVRESLRASAAPKPTVEQPRTEPEHVDDDDPVNAEAERSEKAKCSDDTKAQGAENGSDGAKGADDNNSGVLAAAIVGGESNSESNNDNNNNNNDTNNSESNTEHPTERPPQCDKSPSTAGKGKAAATTTGRSTGPRCESPDPLAALSRTCGCEDPPCLGFTATLPGSADCTCGCTFVDHVMDSADAEALAALAGLDEADEYFEWTDGDSDDEDDAEDFVDDWPL